MSHLQLRGQGQLNGFHDTTAWHNVLRLTEDTTALYTVGDAGVQLRPAFAGAPTPIPDSPGIHRAFTPKFIIVHASLGYTVNAGGSITGWRDGLTVARFRIVTGNSGAGYVKWEEFDEQLPDSALTVYANMPVSAVAGLGLPPKTVVPVVNDMANDDGNYLVAFTRRAILPVKDDAFLQVPANAQWQVQMRCTSNLVGFEYDVLVSGDLA